eukprot:GHRQ01035591.1.p1 GENE.GHRQ01035591.1~~GHRQ01035591.1.p1  ORF type:complete len:160 (-),score=36.98 GHRQ01035591.1:194-673(-)
MRVAAGCACFEPLPFCKLSTHHIHVSQQRSNILPLHMMPICACRVSLCPSAAVPADAHLQALARPADPYMLPTPTGHLPSSITLYQYEVCPFCCKVKAFLDYHKVSSSGRLATHAVQMACGCRTHPCGTTGRHGFYLAAAPHCMHVPGTAPGAATELEP